jgi:hypothetical protein
VHAQVDRVVDALTDKLSPPRRRAGGILAFTAFPKEIWRQI